MKRALSSAFILVILAVVGLLLLTANWSAGSESDPITSNTRTSGSTSPIAVTLTYSEYLTLTDGDIWSMPTPVHTPIVPTERPFLPKPTYPTMTPRPTPTLLPDLGVRMGKVQELTVILDDSFQPTTLPRITYPSVDGNFLVSAVETGQDTHTVVVISLVSGKTQIIPVGQERPREPQISGNYIIWTTFDSLHIHNLDNGQTERKDFDIIRFARISGDIVVWYGAGDIEGYNLSTNEEFPVANDPDVVESLPLISGEWVIYLTSPGSFNAAHLWAVNIQTQEHIYIAEIPLWYRDEQYLDSVYAIDTPWVTWASESTLNLYNLDSRTTFTLPVESCVYNRVNPSGGTTVEHWKPSHLAISENTIIFSCEQNIGYDIDRGMFFSLPTYIPEMEGSGWTGWAISGDQLVWVRNFGPWEEAESHIYTAQIERSP